MLMQIIHDQFLRSTTIQLNIDVIYKTAPSPQD